MKTVLAFTTILASLATSSFAQSIDPDEVPLSTRDSWCQSQQAACPLICVQEEGNSAATIANDCDPDTLDYHCVCSNGQSPNISEYSLTVPYYICTQANTDCQANCGSDNTCAAACVSDHPCGAQNPKRVNATSTASGTASGTASATGSDSTQVYDGYGSSSTASPSDGSKGSGAGRVIVNFGQIYGLGVVAASVFAGFTLLL